MGIKLDELDEIGIIGQPYHGLWKAGQITLPNGSTKACSAPVNEGVALLRVPGLPAVTRGAAEAAADTAAGREWRTYALISGGCYGGSGPLISNDYAAYVWLIDAAKVRWLLRIKRGSSTGQFELQLKRFGHIDGSTQSWSEAILITLSPELWSQIYGDNRLITVAQNTSGREFILGVRNFPTGEYAIALAKINVSGAVDLAAGNRGLGFASASIEWPSRQNDHEVTDIVKSGYCVFTQTGYYKQKQNGTETYTGATYQRVQLFHDGALVSDDGEPPVVSGYTWVTDLPTTYICTSDKTRHLSSVTRSKRTIWASYKEDELILWSLESVYTHTALANVVFVQTGEEGYGHWSDAGDSHDMTRSLISWANDDVVHTFEWSTHDVIGGALSTDRYGGGSPGFVYENNDPYHLDAVTGISSAQTVINVNSQVFMDGGAEKFRATYLTPSRHRGQNFSNPLMVKVQMIRNSGDSTGVLYPISLHAPSGTTQVTGTSWDNLYASWQPVLDTISQDTVPICWF